MSSVSLAEQRLRDVDWSGLPGVLAPVIHAVADVLSGTRAERALDVLLRANRTWDADQRRAAAECVFGVGLWRRRLAYQAGLLDVPPKSEAAEVLLFTFLRDLAALPEQTDAFAFPSRPREPPSEWPIAESMPDFLAAHFRAELGDVEARQFVQALNHPGPVCLRANTQLLSRLELLRALEGEGVPCVATRHAPHGIRLQTRANIYGLSAKFPGAFEVQDEGSQLIVELTDARPGHCVLDFCAGAGGKTLGLANATGVTGQVLANDIDDKKLERLRHRATRANVTTLRICPGKVPEQVLADRVLVDAPCSELGALRRGPDLRFQLTPADLRRWPALQLELLLRASRHVKPGGWLIYATCTLNHAENEAVVESFLRQASEFQILSPQPPWLTPDMRRGNFFLSLPHRHDMDGFFVALFVASADHPLPATSF